MPTKTVKLDNPCHYADGFSLDLYCDHDNAEHSWAEFPHNYYGKTFQQVARDARKDGWTIHKTTRTATCPKCSGKNK